MTEHLKFSDVSDLPEAVLRKIGMGTSRSKILHHAEEDILVTARQEVEEVVIRLTLVKGEKARTIELTEREVQRILLMARDVHRMIRWQADGGAST